MSVSKNHTLTGLEYQKPEISGSIGVPFRAHGLRPGTSLGKVAPWKELRAVPNTLRALGGPHPEASSRREIISKTVPDRSWLPYYYR